MAKNTTNYGFIKPDDDDFYDIQLENTNWDKADQELAKLNSGKVDKVGGKQLSTNDYTNTEKTKLAGVAANANNYTHPSTHPASVTVQDSTHRFVTDTEKSAWNGKVTTSGGDISNTKISTFDASAAELPVPAAGDTTKAFSGKVRKFFEDIKAWKPNVLTKSMLVNNFSTTMAGMVADARALKTLYDNFTQLNQDLGNYYNPEGGIAIPAGANLDAYTTPGSYYSVDSDRTATLSNVPEWQTTGFRLDVIATTTAGWVIQRIYGHNTRPRESIRLKQGTSGVYLPWNYTVDSTRPDTITVSQPTQSKYTITYLYVHKKAGWCRVFCQLTPKETGTSSSVTIATDLPEALTGNTATWSPPANGVQDMAIGLALTGNNLIARFGAANRIYQVEFMYPCA